MGITAITEVSPGTATIEIAPVVSAGSKAGPKTIPVAAAAASVDPATKCARVRRIAKFAA